MLRVSLPLSARVFVSVVRVVSVFSIVSVVSVVGVVVVVVVVVRLGIVVVFCYRCHVWCCCYGC